MWYWNKTESKKCDRENWNSIFIEKHSFEYEICNKPVALHQMYKTTGLKFTPTILWKSYSANEAPTIPAPSRPPAPLQKVMAPFCASA